MYNSTKSGFFLGEKEGKMKHLDVIKILSFGLALSTVTEAGAMSASNQYETYNSLPPTPDYEVYNSLPPTPDYEVYNSLPPTPEYEVYNSLPPTPDYETYNSLPPTPDYEVYNTLPPTPNCLSSQRVNVYALYAQESQNVHY